MSKKYALKTFGTSLLALVMVSVLLFSTGTAQALFRFIGAELRATATVTAVNASSLEVRTSGSTWPITLVANGGTSFGGGYTGLASVQPGDEVQVVADQTGGEFVALEVQKTTDPNLYGAAPCDSFVLSTAIYERPVNGTFYVVKDNVGIKINANNNSQVVNGSMDELVPGTEVVVSGYDCRSTQTLTAQTIEIVNNQGLALCDSYGASAIVVRNRSVLLANDVASATTGKISASVPAGRYRVHGVSFDNHSTSPWDTQANERWFAVGYQGATSATTTGATADLPNGVDYNETVLLDDVNITDLDSIELKHAATIGAEGYQSVYPICVVFEPLDTPAIIDERL